MSYYMAMKGYEESPIKTTVTPDAGFNAARTESKKNPYAVYIVFNWINGHKIVRAFAMNGMAHWAKECTSCRSYGCAYCNNVGYVGVNP